jgi:hypothetical protein
MIRSISGRIPSLQSFTRRWNYGLLTYLANGSRGQQANKGRHTIMCRIIQYAYACHPTHHETLFQPCYTDPYPHLQTRQPLPQPLGTNLGPARRTRKISLKSNNPFLRICPRLWEKRICPPMCVGCVARGGLEEEREDEIWWR